MPWTYRTTHVTTAATTLVTLLRAADSSGFRQRIGCLGLVGFNARHGGVGWMDVCVNSFRNLFFGESEPRFVCSPRHDKRASFRVEVDDCGTSESP